jgi:hypothetical protein
MRRKEEGRRKKEEERGKKFFGKFNYSLFPQSPIVGTRQCRVPTCLKRNFLVNLTDISKNYCRIGISLPLIRFLGYV